MRSSFIEIKGERFAIIPESEYIDLMKRAGAEVDEGLVDAFSYGLQSIGRDLRAAREAAGLTQSELARRLKKSQAMISSAELGQKAVGARYVKAVFRACGLPDDWKPKR